ncbi:MAG: hypothetical protein LBG96_07450 [Tannerella sp.]|jgi:hypothetical protein|nr:hypothetical protein [Tannerella sp.]
MNIAEQAYEKGIRKVTIGFSTGKDSVVGLDMLLKAGIEPIPIYFYCVPGLKFIENNLKMYEDHFGLKIVKLPHPMLYDYINHMDWQPYDRALSIPIYGKATFAEFTSAYLQCTQQKDVEYDCNCMKMADSLNRRLLLSKKTDIDDEKKIIYLTKYLTNNDCFDYIKKNNIPLTDDYKIWGRSWDGLKYDYTKGVKKYYPDDYELIKEYFPLIEAEVLRYKLVKKYDYEKR